MTGDGFQKHKEGIRTIILFCAPDSMHGITGNSVKENSPNMAEN